MVGAVGIENTAGWNFELENKMNAYWQLIGIKALHHAEDGRGVEDAGLLIRPDPFRLANGK